MSEFTFEVEDLKLMREGTSTGSKTCQTSAPSCANT